METIKHAARRKAPELNGMHIVLPIAALAPLWCVFAAPDPLALAHTVWLGPR